MTDTRRNDSTTSIAAFRPRPRPVIGLVSGGLGAYSAPIPGASSATEALRGGGF